MDIIHNGMLSLEVPPQKFWNFLVVAITFIQLLGGGIS